VHRHQPRAARRGRAEEPPEGPILPQVCAESDSARSSVQKQQRLGSMGDAELVEDGMVPHDGGAPCWAGADDPPGSCLDRAADLDREDEV
jgi:hypothetical protein